VFLGHINKIYILLKNNNLHVYHRALLKISGQWFSSLSFKDFHSPTGLFNAAFSSHNALFSGTSLPKRRIRCAKMRIIPQITKQIRKYKYFFFQNLLHTFS